MSTALEQKGTSTARGAASDKNQQINRKARFQANPKTRRSTRTNGAKAWSSQAEARGKKVQSLPTGGPRGEAKESGPTPTPTNSRTKGPKAARAMQRNANLVDLEKRSKNLKNASTLAIVAVDTAENEPSEVCGSIGCLCPCWQIVRARCAAGSRAG